MNVWRRLIILLASSLFTLSAWLEWFGSFPAQRSINSLLPHSSSLGVNLSIDILNQITLSIVILAIAVIGVIAAVSGSRAIALITMFLMLMLIILLSISYNLLDHSASTWLGLVGYGPIVALISSAIILIDLVYPKKQSPAK